MNTRLSFKEEHSFVFGCSLILDGFIDCCMILIKTLQI